MAGSGSALANKAHLAQAGIAEIPSGWEVIQVQDILSDDRGISVGVMYPGDHDPTGVPLIKAGDLSGSLINPRPDFRISPEKHQEYRRTEFSGGEILMTLVGEIGLCAVVSPKMAGWNAARAVAVIRLADPSDAAFLRICFLSKPIRHLMDVWSNTTVQPTLNLKEIRQLPLPWPPKRVRDAIAHILGTLDDKIELNRRMNETLEAMTRALFKSWFVDFDPVRAKLEGRKPAGMDKATAALFPDSFEDSPLGKIPKGWGVGRITDCCQRVGNGGTPKRDVPAYWEPGTIPWLTSGEVRQSVVTATENRISEQGLAKSSAKMWPTWTTVVALYGATAGQTCLLGMDLCANQACCGLVPKQDWRFYNYLRVASSVELMEQQARGSAQQNLSKQIVEENPTVLPSDGVLQRFDEEVASSFECWVANLRESRSLAALRDALLPKLLSGELRVPEAELRVGEVL